MRETKELRDVLNFDKKFKGLQQRAIDKVLSFSHVSAEAMKEMKIEGGDVRLLSVGQFEGFTTKDIASDNLCYGEVITIPTGGAANFKYHNGYFVDSGNILCSPKNVSINGKYVYYFLCKNVDLVDSMFQGASIRHPKMSEICKIRIPICSYEEQCRIVAELELLTEIIDKQKQQLKELDTLAQSIFYDMFGNPVENEKGWNIEPLGMLCDVYRGASPRPIEKFLGGLIPWIKIGDATQGDDIYLHKTKEHIIEEGLKKTRYIHSGSLIFANCGVSLGFARIITFDGCIHDGWLAFDNIKDSMDKVFLLKSLNFCTPHFRRIAPDGTQPNLNTAIMKSFKQIVPPIDVQKKFVEKVKCIESQKQSINRSIAESQKLFDYTMDKYFG